MLNVVILISEPHKTFGSSVLRGEQLHSMCNTFFSGADIRFRLAYSTADISDSFIIFSKMAALTADPKTLGELRSRGNKLYADYLDAQIPAATARLMDGFIASSILQQRFLAARYPGKRVVLVTHHVDLDIPDLEFAHDSFRCAYFGDFGNALHEKHLHAKVDFHDTTTSSREWIRKFPLYSCHYGLRSRRYDFWNRRYRAGFKPFTKGFIAAHVGAVILIGKDDKEALSYLGTDYPYICDGRSLPSVSRALDDMQRSFQSESWHRAVDVMKSLKARIAPQRLKAELTELFFGTA